MRSCEKIVVDKKSHRYQHKIRVYDCVSKQSSITKGCRREKVIDNKKLSTISGLVCPQPQKCKTTGLCPQYDCLHVSVYSPSCLFRSGESVFPSLVINEGGIFRKHRY